MVKIYSARWVLPCSSPAIRDGAIAIDESRIVAVNQRIELEKSFPEAKIHNFDNAAIIPGLVNTHSHLELTAMRGFLDPEEGDFFAWLRKLTLARQERMSAEDLYVSAAWGAIEAVRAGVTCLGDSADSADTSLKALRDVGLRGIVFQESFGPDPRLAKENFAKLQSRVMRLREGQTAIVEVGVSPHAPYTVCGPQLEMIAQFALQESLPLMMHAAESSAETSLLVNGNGAFADGLQARDIEWKVPHLTPIQYLQKHQIFDTRPLLAHCINVDANDLEIIRQTGSGIAHCPRSNAKLGHGRAPLQAFLQHGIKVGLGSDSVASNNSCDLLAEARFAILSARASGSAAQGTMLTPDDGLRLLTTGGAEAMGKETAIGKLEAGYQADFVAVRLDGAHQIPSYDPVSTLIFSSSGSDVVTTVIGGKEVFTNGVVQTVDEVELRKRITEVAHKLIS